MRLLLDTHAFLWMLQEPANLSEPARNAMQDGGNELLLSIGSCWEMAIKQSAGRLSFPAPFLSFIDSQLKANRVSLLPVSLAHLGRLGALPKHPRQHRDPFDRLLVAQALEEGIPLVTRDGELSEYGMQRLW